MKKVNESSFILFEGDFNYVIWWFYLVGLGFALWCLFEGLRILFRRKNLVVIANTQSIFMVTLILLLPPITYWGSGFFIKSIVIASNSTDDSAILVFLGMAGLTTQILLLALIYLVYRKGQAYFFFNGSPTSILALISEYFKAQGIPINQDQGEGASRDRVERISFPSLNLTWNVGYSPFSIGPARKDKVVSWRLLQSFVQKDKKKMAVDLKCHDYSNLLLIGIVSGGFLIYLIVNGGF